FSPNSPTFLSSPLLSSTPPFIFSSLLIMDSTLTWIPCALVAILRMGVWVQHGLQRQIKTDTHTRARTHTHTHTHTHTRERAHPHTHTPYPGSTWRTLARHGP